MLSERSGVAQQASPDSICARLREGQRWFWTNRQTSHIVAGLPRRVQIQSVDLASYAVMVDAQPAPIHPNLFVDGTYSLVPGSDDGLSGEHHVYYRQMFAVSIMQPEAWVIASGIKLLLNTDQVPPAEMLGRKRIWIHASNDINYSDLAEFERMGVPGLPKFSDLARGGLIGSVILERVVNHYPGQWFRGPLAWIFSGPLILAAPLMCKAESKFWVPELYRGPSAPLAKRPA